MLMCLESQWDSMGVSSTKAPARWGGMGSGRRNSWPSLGEILFWCQFPSWSLVNPLPLLPWVDQFLNITTAFTMEMEEVVAEIKRLHQKHIHLAQEVQDAKKQRDKMFNWVWDLTDQRHEVKADIWRLEQDLNGKKEELAQLEARKKELEASGLKGPVVTSSVSGLFQGCFRVVLQLRQGQPQRKGKTNKRDTLACPHKRGRSTISHIGDTYSTGTELILVNI